MLWSVGCEPKFRGCVLPHLLGIIWRHTLYRTVGAQPQYHNTEHYNRLIFPVRTEWSHSWSRENYVFRTTGTEFCIHSSVHRESNRITAQQYVTVFSLLRTCRQLYMFRVLTPIIRSSYGCITASGTCQPGLLQSALVVDLDLNLVSPSATCRAVYRCVMNWKPSHPVGQLFNLTGRKFVTIFTVLIWEKQRRR